MKESRVQDILVSVHLFLILWRRPVHTKTAPLSDCISGYSFQLSALQYRRMDFQEFCAAAVSVHQLEALDRWEQHARSAYEYFEKEGNRAIVIDELASVRDLPPCYLFIRSVWWTFQYFLTYYLLYMLWSISLSIKFTCYLRNWASALQCNCMSFCKIGSGIRMGN